MVLSLQGNMIVGTRFMVIEGFTMGVGGLFMGENLANGVWEKAGAVRATPKPASSMAHSTVTRALALWAHT